MSLEAIKAAIPGLNDSELAEVLQFTVHEQHRRDVLARAPQRAEEIAQEYEEAVGGKPARVWVNGMVIGPGEKVIEGGVEQINVSKAWLSVPPSAYPLGFRRTSPPAIAAPFTVGEVVAQGDLRLWKGVVYKVVQGHTSALHYAPDLPGMTALWVVA